MYCGGTTHLVNLQFYLSWKQFLVCIMKKWWRTSLIIPGHSMQNDTGLAVCWRLTVHILGLTVLSDQFMDMENDCILLLGDLYNTIVKYVYRVVVILNVSWKRSISRKIVVYVLYYSTSRAIAHALWRL